MEIQIEFKDGTVLAISNLKKILVVRRTWYLVNNDKAVPVFKLDYSRVESIYILRKE